MRILKIQTLPQAKDNWIDKDLIMLHACFQLLVDWVEKEEGLLNWSHPDYTEAISKLKSLHDWWKLTEGDCETTDEKLLELVGLRGYMWT